MSDKPVGSGVFAVIIGAVFIVGILFRPDLLKINPETVLKAWIIVSGGFLIVWGLTRIIAAEKKHRYDHKK